MARRKIRIRMYSWVNGLLEIKDIESKRDRNFCSTSEAREFAKELNDRHGHRIKIYDEENQLCEHFGNKDVPEYA